MTRPMLPFAVSPLTGLSRNFERSERSTVPREDDIRRLRAELGDMGALLEETEQRRHDRRRPVSGHRAEVA